MSVEFNNLIRDYAHSAQLSELRNELNGNDKEYPMLRWNKHDKKLEVVMRSETSGMERFLKWIGVGPLSLKKVAHELEKNKDKLDGLRFTPLPSSDSAIDSAKSLEEVSNEDIEIFANAVLNQFQNYNAHRLINKVEKSNFSVVNKMHELVTVAQVGNTYGDETNADNLDFVHANNKFGFAFIADNGDSVSQKEKKSKTYEDFYNDYIEELRNQQFSSFKEVQDFVKAKEKDLIAKLSNSSPLPKSFSLAQIIKNEDGTLELLSAQIGDSMIVIKRGDNFIYVNKHPYYQSLQNDPLHFERMLLERGDEVLGFSDGIAEYFTRDEFEDIVNANEDRSQLLQELQDAIMAEKPDAEAITGVGLARESSIPENDLWNTDGRPVKTHDFEKNPYAPSNHDDISLFVLDTNKFSSEVRIS